MPLALAMRLLMGLLNGMIGAGMSCQVIHYPHEEHDKFFEFVFKYDIIGVRRIEESQEEKTPEVKKKAAKKRAKKA